MRRVVAAVALALLMTACPAEDDRRLTGEAARGQDLVRERGCLSCHSTDGSRRTGPTFRGLYGSEVTLADGETVVADAGYLRSAITDPEATTVEGFPSGAMARAVPPSSIPSDDVDAIIAYIRTVTETPGR